MGEGNCRSFETCLIRRFGRESRLTDDGFVQVICGTDPLALLELVCLVGRGTCKKGDEGGTEKG